MRENGSIAPMANPMYKGTPPYTGAWADDPSFLNSAGVSVQMKEWERSEHAGHLRHHREEYVHLLRDFMHQQQPPTTTTTAAGVVEHGDGGSARARKRR